jgi:hypothetical protein
VFNSGSPFGSSDIPMEIDLANPVYPEPIWVQWSPKMHAEIASMRAEIEALSDREPYERRTPEQRAHEQMLTMRAHIVLTTIKQAVKMGWIHGRPNPSDQDWDLARIQMDVSTAELAGVWQECQAAGFTLAQETGARRAVEQISAENYREMHKAAVLAEIESKIFRTLCKAPLSPRDLFRKFRSPLEKPLVKLALANLETAGRVEFETSAEAVGRPSGLWWALRDGARVAARVPAGAPA